MLNKISKKILEYKLKRITRSYLESVNFENIRQDYFQKERNQSKFVDSSFQINKNIHFIDYLNLDQRTQLSILDIGCGAGWFLFLCKMLGHQVHGLDVNNNEQFNRMITMFDMDRTVHQIKPFTSLPKLNKKFDLITSFLITFNGRNEENYWEKEEFDFFLKDLADNYARNENTRIFLQFNNEKGANNIFFSNQLKQYFVENGAEINQSIVYFKDISKLCKSK